MQTIESQFFQFGGRAVMLAFLLIYCVQVVGLEHFSLADELDLLELNIDLESDSEEKKSAEDIDDHLTSGGFSGPYLLKKQINPTYFLTNMGYLTRLEPGYPPPEAV